jgi:hypothetical protein
VSQVFKVGASLLMALVLSACGGGGDAGSPEPANGTKYTQDDIKSVAAAGLVPATFILTDNGAGIGVLGGFLVSRTSQTGGSTGPVVESCVVNGNGHGSLTYSVTKSAFRTGFAAGDQVVVTFNDCDRGGGIVNNGTATFTATNNLANLSTASFDYGVDVRMTNFSARYRSSLATFDGVATLITKFLSSNLSLTQKLAVPAGQTLRVTLNNQVLEYAGGASVSIALVSIPNSATTRLDGDVKVTNAGKTVALSASTPITLSGSTNAAGQFLATSGTIAVKDTARNIATSTTVSGNNTSVSGDTDGNGSLDLTFSTTWLSLIGQ